MTDPMAKYLMSPTLGAQDDEEEDDPMLKYLKPEPIEIAKPKPTIADRFNLTKLADGMGDVRMAQNIGAGALETLGGLFNTAGSAATGINKQIAKLTGHEVDGPSFLTQFGNKLKSWGEQAAPETPADGMLQSMGDIAGRFTGAAIVSAPVGGVANKLAAKGLSFIPGALTNKALQATAAITSGISNATAAGFVEGALTAIPREVIAGGLTQAAIDPESLATSGGIAQGIGFSILGSSISGIKGAMAARAENPLMPAVQRGKDFLKGHTRIARPTHTADPLESSVQRRSFGGDPDIANKVHLGPYPKEPPIYGPFPLSSNPDPAAVYAYAKPDFPAKLGPGAAPNKLFPARKGEGPNSQLHRGRPVTTDEALDLLTDTMMEPPQQPNNIIGTLVGAFDRISGRDVERKFFNAKSAFRVVDEATGTRHEHGLEATANLLSGNGGRVHGILHDRPMLPLGADPNSGYVDVGLDPLTKVMELIPDKEMRRFSGFMHARHRLDKGVIAGVAQGRAHPITEDIARLAVQDSPAHWKAAAEKLDALNKFNLDYMHRSNVISDGSYDWLVENYPSFVSLSRGLNESSFAVPTLKRKGSDVGNLRDVFQTYIENTIAVVNMSENNRFKKQLYETAIHNENALRGIVRVHPVEHSTLIDATLDELRRRFKDNAIDAPQAVLKELAVALAPKDPLRVNGNNLNVMINGIAREMTVNDDLAEALKTMGYKAPDPYISALAKGEKVPRKLTSLFLDLTLRGPFKDWLETYVNSAAIPEYGTGLKKYIPVNPLKGLKEIRNRGQYFQELQMEGGIVGNRFLGIGGKEMANNFESLRKEAALKGVKAKLQHPIQALEQLAADLSQANRVALFMRLKDNGVTSRQAAIEARRIIPDPMQVGAAMRSFAQATSFGNTGVQAINNYKRVFQNAGTKPEFWVKGMVAHVIPAATLWAIAKANNDTALDEIRQAPGGERFLYWRNPYDPETIVTIPKGWGWSQVFGTGTEAALDKIFNDDPEAGKNLVHGILGEVGVNMIPLSVQAAGQLSSGTRLDPLKMLTGENYSGQQRGAPGFQEQQNTSELSKFIGQKTGISPVTMDNGIKALLTSEGFKWVNLASNTVSGNVGMMRRQDLPQTGGWIRKDNQSTNTRSNAEFYKEVDKARNLTMTLNKLAANGRMEEWSELIQRDPTFYAKIPIYGAFATQMSEFKKLIDMTKAMPNDSLSPSEKRKQIDGILKQINEYTHIIMTSMNEQQ